MFLTGHGDVPASVRAMKRGAADFLQKPVAADELLAAVSSALLRDAETRRHLVELAELRALADTLSDRQREVWLRVVRGDLNKQIAHDLGIVERTVKLHRAKAMESCTPGPRRTSSGWPSAWASPAAKAPKPSLFNVFALHQGCFTKGKLPWAARSWILFKT